MDTEPLFLIACASNIYDSEHENDNPLPMPVDDERSTVDGARVTLRDEDGDVLGVYEFGPSRRRKSDHEFYRPESKIPVFMRRVQV